MFTGLLRGQFKISMAAVGHHTGAVVSDAFQQEGRGLNPLCICLFCVEFAYCPEVCVSSPLRNPTHTYTHTQVKDVHVWKICNSERCLIASVNGCLSSCGRAIKYWLVQDVLCLHPKRVGMEASNPTTPSARGWSWVLDKWLQLVVHTMWTAQKPTNQHKTCFAQVKWFSKLHILYWILYFATHGKCLVYH